MGSRNLITPAQAADSTSAALLTFFARKPGLRSYIGHRVLSFYNPHCASTHIDLTGPAPEKRSREQFELDMPDSDNEPPSQRVRL